MAWASPPKIGKVVWSLLIFLKYKSSKLIFFHIADRSKLDDNKVNRQLESYLDWATLSLHESFMTPSFKTNQNLIVENSATNTLFNTLSFAPVGFKYLIGHPYFLQGDLTSLLSMRANKIIYSLTVSTNPLLHKCIIFVLHFLKYSMLHCRRWTLSTTCIQYSDGLCLE